MVRVKIRKRADGIRCGRLDVSYLDHFVGLMPECHNDECILYSS